MVHYMTTSTKILRVIKRKSDRIKRLNDSHLTNESTHIYDPIFDDLDKNVLFLCSRVSTDF